MLFQIREGRNLTGKQLLKACGYLLPNPVFSDTNVVSLRIYAHQAQAYQYSLTFTSSPNGKGCGGKLYNYFGLFTSPMYPNIYRENIKCTWDIHVPNGYKVALKLKRLNFFQISLQSIYIIYVADFNIGGDCAQNKVVVTTYSASGTNDLTYCKVRYILAQQNTYKHFFMVFLRQSLLVFTTIYFRATLQRYYIPTI